MADRERRYGMVAGDADDPQFWWLLSNEMLASRIGWWRRIAGTRVWLRWATWPIAMAHDLVISIFRRGGQNGG